jgi:hypothetical protein
MRAPQPKHRLAPTADSLLPSGQGNIFRQRLCSIALHHIFKHENAILSIGKIKKMRFDSQKLKKMPVFQKKLQISLKKHLTNRKRGAIIAHNKK